MEIPKEVEMAREEVEVEMKKEENGELSEMVQDQVHIRANKSPKGEMNLSLSDIYRTGRNVSPDKISARSQVIALESPLHVPKEENISMKSVKVIDPAVNQGNTISESRINLKFEIIKENPSRSKSCTYTNNNDSNSNDNKYCASSIDPVLTDPKSPIKVAEVFPIINESPDSKAESSSSPNVEQDSSEEKQQSINTRGSNILASRQLMLKAGGVLRQNRTFKEKKNDSNKRATTEPIEEENDAKKYLYEAKRVQKAITEESVNDKLGMVCNIKCILKEKENLPPKKENVHCFEETNEVVKTVMTIKNESPKIQVAEVKAPEMTPTKVLAETEPNVQVVVAPVSVMTPTSFLSYDEDGSTNKIKPSFRMPMSFNEDISQTLQGLSSTTKFRNGGIMNEAENGCLDFLLQQAIQQRENLWKATNYIETKRRENDKTIAVIRHNISGVKKTIAALHHQLIKSKQENIDLQSIFNRVLLSKVSE